MKIGFFSDFVLHNNIKIDKSISNKIKINDLNCLNLEAPFIKKKFKKINKGINLYNKTEDLKFLNNNKFNIVNLANNHIFDFGLDGFKYTKNILDKNNIQYFGAGENIIEASKPVIISIAQKSIAFFGFAWNFTDAINASERAYGTNPVELDFIIKLMEEYKKIDYKVAYFHFGTEFEDYPEPYHKYIIETLFNFDLLDLVIGNHSHCIQGYSDISIDQKRKLVFYSLGNFILPETKYLNKRLSFRDKSHIGYFVNVDFDNNFNYEIIPYRLINNSFEIVGLEGSEQNEVYKKIKKISGPLKFDFKEYRKFYLKNRARKTRPIFTKNKSINEIKKFCYLKMYKIRNYFYANLIKLLKIINVYQIAKTIKRKIINKH